MAQGGSPSCAFFYLHVDTGDGNVSQVREISKNDLNTRPHSKSLWQPIPPAT